MADDTSLIGRLRASILGATITQRFGCTGYSREPAPWWTSGLNCQHFHTGVDLVLAGGTRANVYAPASGIVTQVDTNPNVSYGYSVRIRDPQGLTWIVGHLLASPRVSVGDHVQAGTVLGNQGATGNASGPHLHLEVRNAQNVPLNPARNAQGAVIGSGIDNGVTPGDIFYGLGHVFGFGAGPTQGGIQVPPDPVTGGVPASGVTGGTPPGVPPGSNGGGGSSSGTWESDACQLPTPATGPLDYPRYAADMLGYQTCVIQHAIGDALNPVKQFQDASGFVKTEVAPLVIVGFAGLVLVFAGFRKLTQEPPVKVITAPVSAAKAGVEGAGRTVGTVAATAVGQPGAAAVIGARGVGAKAQTVANQAAARRVAKAKAAKAAKAAPA